MALHNERLNLDRVRFEGKRYSAGDIEIDLLRIPVVQDAAVVQSRSSVGNGRVVAFVELAEGSQIPPDAVENLPVHEIIPVSALPLDRDGAVDFERLRDISVIDSGRREEMYDKWSLSAGLSDWAFSYREHYDVGTQLSLSEHGNNSIVSHGAKPYTAKALPVLAEPAHLVGEHLRGLREVSTLPDVLRRTAERLGGRGCHFIDYDMEERVLTYRELLNKSEAIASGLHELGVQVGDRVMLLASSHMDFVVAFWSVQLAGATAVPVTSSDYAARPSEAEALRRIWATAKRPVVLVSSDLMIQVGDVLVDAELHDIDTIEKEKPGAIEANINPDAPAVILFTSGSTGIPKGVVQTHHTIISKQLAAVQHSAYADDDVFFNWLAIEHVVGLIHSHILPIYLGANQVHAVTQAVLADPRRWLDIISQYRVSITWAPNSMFALLADAISPSERGKWDLSCLKRWINAGEQVHFATCQRILKLLEPSALPRDAVRPEWGMSETCNMVVASDRLSRDSYGGIHAVSKIATDGTVVFTTFQDTEATLYVECGQVYPGTEARVVDDAGFVLLKGQVGRFQVRGVTRLVEYFNNPEANMSAFTSDGWFDTGDLAFFVDDAVVFVGRDVDRIIINGVNLQNVDIESGVESVEGVVPSYVAACAVRDQKDATDQLAVFYVTSFVDEASLRHQYAQIQGLLMRQFGTHARYLLALEREQIPKTSIGKIQRSKLVRALLAGDLAEEVSEARMLEGNEPEALPPWFYSEEWVPAKVQVMFTDVQVKIVGGGLSDIFANAIKENLAKVTSSPNRSNSSLSENTPPAQVLPKIETVIDMTLTQRNWSTNDVSKVIERLARSVRGQHTLIVTAADQARNAQALARAAQLYGLVRSFDSESTITATVCDIDEQSQETAALLVREALATHRRPRTRIRRGIREVTSLSPVTPSVQALPVSAEEGAALITGGLGGVGSYVSRHLGGRFTRGLILVGKTQESQLSDEARATLSELRNRTECHYLDVDLGAPNAESKLAQRLASLGGIQVVRAYHLAGLGSFGSVASAPNVTGAPQQLWNSERLARFTAVKADGLLAVANVVGQGVPIIAFSSINAYFGGVGHAEYAAANSALNAVAEILQKTGHTVTTIGWSAWRGIGMSRNGSSETLLKSRGFAALSQEQALDCLDLLTRTDKSGCSPVYVGLDGAHTDIAREVLRKKNWALWPICAYVADQEIIDPQLLHPQLEVIRTDRIPRAANGLLDFARLIASKAEKVQPETDMERRLACIWEEVLNTTGFSRYDDYFLVGGNSLNAARLVVAIQAEFSVSFPLHLIYRYSRLDSMAAHILDYAKSNGIKQSEKSTVIDSCEAKDRLSHAQQQIFFAETADDRALYNIVSAWRLIGDVETTYLEKALIHLTQRHESLRTSFSLIDGVPKYSIANEVAVFVKHLDFTAFNSEECAIAINNLLEQEVSHKFDLSVAPLARYFIVRASQNEAILVLCHHHSISDGWSLGVFLRELSVLYTALQTQNIPDLPPVSQDIGSMIAKLDDSAIKSSIAETYWRSTLLEEIEPLRLPLDYPRPLVRNYAGDTLFISIDSALVNLLDRAAQKCGVTRSVFLAGVFAVFLSKLSGQPRLVFGLPAMRRAKPELINIVGMLVNTLPIVIDVREDTTIDVFLAGLHDQVSRALENQDFPFDRLVSLFAPERPTNFPPLVQAVFNYVPKEDSLNLTGVVTEPMHIRHRVAKFDLSVHVYEDGDSLTLAFEYASSLFNSNTIKRWQGWFLYLLNSIATNSSQRISLARLVSPEESKNILEMCTNRRTAALPTSLAAAFNLVVSKHAHRPAVRYGEKLLSYIDLDQHSATLAAQLEDAGVKAGHRVGLIGTKKPETIVAIIAIARIGCSYVPLDPEASFSVRENILHTGEVTWVIGSEGIKATNESMFPIALDFFGTGRTPISEPYNDHEAYVIFTSGTTGRPKGVAIRSSSVLGLVTDPNWIQLDENCRLVQTGSIAFDASTFEIWGPLLAGGEIILVDNETLLDPSRFSDALSKYRPTVMWLSAPLFHQLADADPSMFTSCEIIVVGGDVVSPEHIKRVAQCAPEVKFINGYGPTENTTFSTTHQIEPETLGPVPIGRPVRGSIAVPLDVWGHVVPVGVEGELYVGGEGLSTGYVGGDTPSDKFVETVSLPDMRLYRTGDFVRLGEDGSLRFCGRRDDQVKIRGHRVELASVRNALQALDNVRDAFVTVSHHGSRAVLVGHVAGEESLDGFDFVSALRKELPPEAIPGAFYVYDALPLRASGKVDTNQLVTSTTQETPHNEINLENLLEPERTILEVFRQVLDVPLLGLRDSFFDHGGDSLLTIKLVSRLTDKGLAVDAKQIFLAPDVASLASLLENPPTMSSSNPKDKLIDLGLSLESSRKLVFLPPAGGTILGYIQLARYLRGFGSAYGVEAPGLGRGESQSLLSFEEMVDFCQAAVADVVGPDTLLAGHSLGGHIAFHLCSRLVASGNPPKGLIILDTPPDLGAISTADADFSEEETKVFILAMGIGGFLEAEAERLREMPYEQAKKYLLQVARDDARVATLLNEDYLERFLTLQMHQLMYSREVTLPRERLNLPISVLRTTKHTADVLNLFSEWQEYTTRPVTFADIPGDHTSMMRFPHVQEVARIIDLEWGETANRKEQP
ncbi:MULTISPECIES: non-ribosomal peptide synthetase [Rothia]|uniref:Carrier domain-containing protein n=2 Tax=Rothia TaxID=32207 RepID=A0A1Y1RP53_9MICC|nr:MULTISPECIES: non-ribosomal peptide synthetase [Rothia]ORC16617.1 hypothetical protein A7979_04520 [Rothia nasimurium]